jgi:hypothetical protein
MPESLPISPDLLEILRDPKAIQDAASLGLGPDPGRLTLVRGSWLVSADTGYKYPIRDGIPVMLVEEGARWKDTPIDMLPVPPPVAEPPVVEPSRSSPTTVSEPVNPFRLLAVAVVGIFAALLVYSIVRRMLDHGDAAE